MAGSHVNENTPYWSFLLCCGFVDLVDAVSFGVFERCFFSLMRLGNVGQI